MDKFLKQKHENLAHVNEQWMTVPTLLFIIDLQVQSRHVRQSVNLMKTT